jgi:hypothetical protein
MNHDMVHKLAGEACASIRYRTRKEILEENPDRSEYLAEILDDPRVGYVFSWQHPDGYLGRRFHGGWIPYAKTRQNTGAESALRFLSEMGIPSDHPVVAKGLQALLNDHWYPDPWKWPTVYKPEIGLFGMDYVRSVVFAYFGIEGYDFIQTEIRRALEVMQRAVDIHSISDITGSYQNKLYFNQGIVLPDLYHLRLLAFTQSWRNDVTTGMVARSIEHLINLSPLPVTYIKCGSQLVAPARIMQDLKQSPLNLNPADWFWWLQTMELFARMGIIKSIPEPTRQVAELQEFLQLGGGFFPFKPKGTAFENWSVYAGMALEEKWKNNRWKYDLTFRALLILKYSGLL